MTVHPLVYAFAIFSVFAGSAPVNAADPAASLRAEVREVQRIHQEQGMAGLEAVSRECWAGRGGFRCLHMDVAAGTIDRSFADALGIGVHPYFAVEPLLRRATPVFTRARWDMDTSNAYLQFLDGAVRGVLNEGKSR